eukprot:SAG31_NODE_4041_length_3642_cov_2.683601_1_plen_1147_part_01
MVAPTSFDTVSPPSALRDRGARTRGSATVRIRARPVPALIWPTISCSTNLAHCDDSWAGRAPSSPLSTVGLGTAVNLELIPFGATDEQLGELPFKTDEIYHTPKTATSPPATGKPGLQLRLPAGGARLLVLSPHDEQPLRDLKTDDESESSQSSMTYGINNELKWMVVVKSNAVKDASGTHVAIDTAAKLQELLDDRPNTAIYVVHSSFEVVPDGNRTGITIRSNRSLVLDAQSVIWCNSTLPSPLYLPAAEAKYGPHLVALMGNNTGLKGGQLLDYTNHNTEPTATVPITIGIRIFHSRDAKVVGVTLKGGWGNAIRVFNNDGATSPSFVPCPNYFTVGCQASQLPFAQGLPYSHDLALAELMLKAQVQPPVSLINNTIIAQGTSFRGIWLTWAFGVVTTRNTIRGPLHYGIDLDAMASYCTITNNDVATSLPGRVAFFIEMQCRNNVVTANRFLAPKGYGMNLNSFLNVIVSNDLAGSNMKLSGVAPYPAALSNRLIDNVGIGRFNTQHAGCGNYAAENLVDPHNVSNEMALTNCTHRPGGCTSPLNRSSGCIDPDAGLAAMLFSDVAPTMPGCTALGGLWLATGHDRITVNVTQRSNELAWTGLGPFSDAGDTYNGTATIAGHSLSGTIRASYKYSKGYHHSTYRLVATLPATCDEIQWLRLHNGPPEPFENWTKIQASVGGSSADRVHALAQQLAQNQRERDAVEDEARVLEQRRVVLRAKHTALRATLETEADQSALRKIRLKVDDTTVGLQLRVLSFAAILLNHCAEPLVTAVWVDIENGSTIVGDYLRNASAVAHTAGLKMAVDAQVQWAFKIYADSPSQPLYQQLMNIVDEITLMDYWTACANVTVESSGESCDPTQALFLIAPWLSYASFLQEAQNRTVLLDLGVALKSATDRPGLTPGRIPDELQLELFLQRSAKVLRKPGQVALHSWSSRHFHNFAIFDHFKYLGLLPCPTQSRACAFETRQPRALWWYQLFGTKSPATGHTVFAPLNSSARTKLLSFCAKRRVTELYLDQFDEWGNYHAVAASFVSLVKEADAAGIDIQLYVGNHASATVVDKVANVASWCATTHLCGSLPQATWPRETAGHTSSPEVTEQTAKTDDALAGIAGGSVASHLKIMSFYGFNPSKMQGWVNLGIEGE